MQSQDPGISKQYYRNYENRIASQMSSRVSPGSNPYQGKTSYSPGHWKKYIASDANLKSPQRKSSQYDYNYKNNDNETYEQLSRQFAIDRAKQENQTNKFQQQKRKKQQMMKRVQQIQKKVLPILKSQRNNQQIDQNFGWQNRMQQRILKIQTHIDYIEKQMQIKIQKRLLQVERDWKARIQALVNSNIQVQQKKINKPSSKSPQNIKTVKPEPKRKRIEQEELYTTNQKYGSKVPQKSNDIITSEAQFQNQNSQGYYTRRQNQRKSFNEQNS